MDTFFVLFLTKIISSVQILLYILLHKLNDHENIDEGTTFHLIHLH